RFINAVTDGDAVPDPALTRAGPDNFGIRGIDCYGANGLHIRAIENGLERCAAVDRLPDAAARRSDEDGEPALFVDRVDGGDAATHRRRSDVARGQTGDRTGVVSDCLLGDAG